MSGTGYSREQGVYECLTAIRASHEVRLLSMSDAREVAEAALNAFSQGDENLATSPFYGGGFHLGRLAWVLQGILGSLAEKDLAEGVIEDSIREFFGTPFVLRVMKNQDFLPRVPVLEPVSSAEVWTPRLDQGHGESFVPRRKQTLPGENCQCGGTVGPDGLCGSCRR